MTVGENIKRIRKKKGLTQRRLGELCGINEANIRKYESGKQNPKIETLARIASALNVDTYDLIEIPFKPFTNSDDFQPHPDKNKILNDVYLMDLLDAFNELNLNGKQCAVSQVQLVASIPEYQKKYDDQ